MDLQQIAALALVALAAAFLVRRYALKRRSPKPGHCADCAPTATKAPAGRQYHGPAPSGGPGGPRPPTPGGG